VGRLGGPRAMLLTSAPSERAGLIRGSQARRD